MVQIQRNVPTTTTQRCLRVWLALVLQARLGKTIPYECLACLVGVPAQTFNSPYGILARIRRYCEHHELPLLDVLITGAATEMPSGPRWVDWTEAEIVAMVNQVFDHDWAGIAIPDAGDFR